MIDRSKLSPSNLEALQRLEELYGQSLNLSSGHRTPDYNNSVGGAKKSQHIHGNAIDIDVANMNEKERLRFASAAKKSGYKGFGFYDNSLHFDVGNPRIWGPDYTKNSVPDYANSWYNMNNSGDSSMAYGFFPEKIEQNTNKKTGLGGLLSSFVTPDETTGLSPLKRLGASLDNLLPPGQGGGDRIRETGKQRLAKQTKNRTIEALTKSAATDPRAKVLLDAVRSGALTPADAYKEYLSIRSDGSKNPIRATQKYLNGTLYTVTDTGRTVINPEGKEVVGEEAAEVLAEANRYENENRAIGEGLSAGAKFQQEAAKEMYDKADTIRGSITNIDQAIAAIDRGAPRGIYSNMLPDITAQSGALTSALRRMGLDVVSSVTFGALSQSELDIAMATAYPENASAPELRKFLEDRKVALNKLLNYTDEAADFMSNPNNTRAQWREVVNERAASRELGGTNPFVGLSLDRLQAAFASVMDTGTPTQKAQLLEALKAARGN